MNLLKKYPISIAGLILSLFALGNMLASYSTKLRFVIGGIAAFLYVIYVLKLILLSQAVKEEIENPVPASVLPTFTMATMLFAAYIKIFSFKAAIIIWYIGFAGHVFLILYFSAKFLMNFSIKKVFPSWFIVYVGIAAASVTSPVMGTIYIGRMAFWFSFVLYYCLLPVVCYRIWKVKEIPEPAKPTLIIIAAPASLLLAGYMSCFDQKNIFIVYLLLIFSLLFYITALIYLLNLIKMKFNPGHSAFTFPLVISALAVKFTNIFFASQNTVLNIIVRIEEIIAIIVVALVFVRYIIFLFKLNTENKIR